MVLAGAHHAYFLDDVRTYDEQRGLITVNVENVAKALERTVADIRRLGKRVVLVRSPPRRISMLGFASSESSLASR